jgi:hypothetical protein
LEALSCQSGKVLVQVTALLKQLGMMSKMDGSKGKKMVMKKKMEMKM